MSRLAKGYGFLGILMCCFLSLLWTSAAPVSAAPVVKEGRIDLSGYNLAESGSIELKGDWLFYEQVFLLSEPAASSESRFLQTPGSWGSRENGMEDRGYGTYRLEMLLSEEDIGQTLGLYVPAIASAYELFTDGKLLARQGRVGKSQETMSPSALPLVVYFTPKAQAVELTVHVSNFSQRKGGMWDRLRLGYADQITGERERSLLFQMFIFSGLLVMGIYHTVLYFFRTSRSALFFGLACLSFCLRTGFVGDLLAVRIAPSIPWELGVKAEYLSVLAGVSFLVFHFRHLYRSSFSQAACRGLVLMLAIMAAPIVLYPARVYTEGLIVYEGMLLVMVSYIIYGLIRAVRKRSSGAKLNLATGLAFMGTLINDIFRYSFQLNSFDLVMLGLFLFVCVQMFLLSGKFSSAFWEAERLKNELVDINANLEGIVAERTAELQRSNENLVSSEKARKDLLSHITHELGNPLTSILGYLRRLRNGVSKEEEARHIQIAYQKALKLERLTEDLRQLVKLEHGQWSFDWKSIKLRELYEELQGVYDWNLLNRRVDFRLRLSAEADPDIRIDLFRIEQVFTNIMDNALAHTTPGTRISVFLRYLPCSGACVFGVQDEGCGIPKEEQPRIFERFYRVKNEENDLREGTGLGLTLSKAIVEAHQGRIGVISEYGRGSVFYFILPVQEGHQ